MDVDGATTTAIRRTERCATTEFRETRSSSGRAPRVGTTIRTLPSFATDAVNRCLPFAVYVVNDTHCREAETRRSGRRRYAEQVVPSSLRTVRIGLTLAVLAVLVASCSLLQAERTVVRSFKYWAVIECRGEAARSSARCREWGEGVIAARPPAPESTYRLMLLSEGGQCTGFFLDQSGNELETFDVPCP